MKKKPCQFIILTYYIKKWKIWHLIILAEVKKEAPLGYMGGL